MVLRAGNFLRFSSLFLILILSDFCLLMAFAQETGFPVIRNYTPIEYNNSPQIRSSIQCNLGILYFAGGDGIIEYDGVTWRNIPYEKPVIPYDFVKDKKDKIYVAATGEFGFLKTGKSGNTTYQSLTNLIIDPNFKIGIVFSVKTTSKHVYFQTYDAVLQYTEMPENLLIFKADTNGRFYGDFVYQDVYYTRLSMKGLMKIENNTLKAAPQTGFFKNKNNFSGGLPFDSTTVLIPTRTEGLYLYKPTYDILPQKFNISDKEFLEENVIYKSAVFQKDYFVLGSTSKGALLIDKQGKALQHFQESNMLQTNQIYRITGDMSRNLWFGLNNGISKSETGQDLSYWNRNSGLKGMVISVIRYNGVIYIATYTNVYFIDKKNQIQEVQDIPTGQNWYLLETQNVKSLLVGTSQGIYEIEGVKAVPIHKGSHACVLYQSLKNPDRVFSTDFDSLIVLKCVNGKWMAEGKFGNVKDQVRGIIEDENGDIWLGTFLNGIIRITPDYGNFTKPQSLRYYSQKDGLRSLKNILPFKFKNRIVWCTEKGLVCYNRRTDRFEPFCELGEQFCNGSRDVLALVEMLDGKIWVCPAENKKADIGFLQPNKTGGYDWVYAPFRRIPQMFLESFYIEPSGVAWIGGSEGIYRYDMHKDTKNYSQQFNCLIRKVTAGQDSIICEGSPPQNLKETTKLPYKYNSLKFEFAAPFFDQEEKTLYSHQLFGYDKEWSKWSRESSKEYTNLWEGKYTFRVKARNIYDVESEPGNYQISFLPPFYRKWWAYLIYVFLSCLLVFGIVRWNSRRLLKEKERLEDIVKQRTTEIIDKNSELEEQYKKIEEQNLHIEHKNNELVNLNATKDKFFSSIAHDLRGPLGGFMGLSQIMAEELSSLTTEEVQEYAVSMNNSATNLFRLLENLLSWARMQQGSIPFDPKYWELVSLVNESVEMIREPAKSKEIEIDYNITEGIMVFADKTILQTVIRNLVSNSIKFTKKSGKITLSAEAKEGKTVEISIKDNGIGMNKTMVDNLFKPDVRTGRNGTEGEPSTGLGLLLCKEFVEKHGGTIRVESEEGYGSTFTFTIPG